MPNSKRRTNGIRWWDLNNPPLPDGARHAYRACEIICAIVPGVRPDKAFTPPSATY
ncbi:hypothetical protein KCP75_00690 [Salmonella enterica subsp. enterica]|nr:hypothetical protein KCP75_00690 [Salmonella enterica subsp. enterica]